jgi:hypothetical protein
VKPGDTFRFADPTIDNHLWVVLSDPLRNDREILVVSITSWHEFIADHSCILDPGDHPAITHRSCVYYDLAGITTAECLTTRLDEGWFIDQPPMEETILTRVYDGAFKTEFLTYRQRSILIEQDLIPPF